MTRVAWSGLQWPFSTVAVLASGESLSLEQCEAVRVWRAAGEGRRVIVVNTTFERAPWADVLYGCDAPWWRKNYAKAAELFHGEHWTQDPMVPREFAVKRVESVRLPGLGRRPGQIHQGYNSGYQAINLAYQAGAEKIILFGFDFHGEHWHGKHKDLPNPTPVAFKIWLGEIDQLALDLKAEGVDVVNCSVGSAIGCFRMGAFEAELT